MGSLEMPGELTKFSPTSFSEVTRISGFHRALAVGEQEAVAAPPLSVGVPILEEIEWETADPSWQALV